MAGTKSKIQPPPAVPTEEGAAADAADAAAGDDDTPQVLPPAAVFVDDPDPRPPPAVAADADGDTVTDGDLVIVQVNDGLLMRRRPGAPISGRRTRGNWIGRVGDQSVTVEDGCPVVGMPDAVAEAVAAVVVG